jgi:hypothetical protein
MRIHKEPKITEDTRYDLPRAKIKDTGDAVHFFIPKRLHKDSTHARTNETKRFPGWVGQAPSPNLRYIYIYIYIYIHNVS